MSKKQNKLYGYIFHFNDYTGLWAAIPRELEKDYFNGGMANRINSKILFAKDMNTLVEFLEK